MQFSDNHFDVVLDKGSLDALMGEVGESSVAAEKYLHEVSTRPFHVSFVETLFHDGPLVIPHIFL